MWLSQIDTKAAAFKENLVRSKTAVTRNNKVLSDSGISNLLPLISLLIPRVSS